MAVDGAHRLPAGYEEWEQVGTKTETIADFPVVTVRAHSAVFEPADVHGLADRIGRDVDKAPRGLFTTQLRFDPPPPKAPQAVLPVAAKYAKREFGRSLETEGLDNVSVTDERRFRYDGGTGRAFRYRVEYPLDGTAVTTAERPEIIPLACIVWGAIWPAEPTFAMGGGIYPVESIEDAVDAAGGTPDGDIELAVAPDDHRGETFALLREIAASA
ncbi:MAG: hypothetical protein SVG88_10810 [Halobacteriales archaeon]|nr:hypothetical protein [Halobacteriales archaeon]